jgi:Fic family protein
MNGIKGMPDHAVAVAAGNPADGPMRTGYPIGMDYDELDSVSAWEGTVLAGMMADVRDNQTRRHNRGERQAINMRRVLETIRQHAEAPDWLLTESSIKEFNRIVLDGIPRESYSAGDYKRRKNLLLDGCRRVVFTPPLPGECAPLVAELVQTVNRWIEERRADSPAALHPVRIAAIVCSQLIAIHPFAQGNGRTSRAVATMTLATFGYAPLPSERDDENTAPVKTLEWYFDKHLSDYYAGLHAARRGNWPIWIDIFAEAVHATMKCPLGMTYRAG